MISRKALAAGYGGVDNRGLTPNGIHFEPQRTSVRAGRLVISCKSGPHANEFSHGKVQSDISFHLKPLFLARLLIWFWLRNLCN